MKAALCLSRPLVLFGACGLALVLSTGCDANAPGGLPDASPPGHDTADAVGPEDISEVHTPAEDTSESPDVPVEPPAPPCVGTTPTCDSRSDEEACDALAGCFWKTDAYCRSQVDCGDYDDDDSCQEHLTCLWSAFDYCKDWGLCDAHAYEATCTSNSECTWVAPRCTGTAVACEDLPHPSACFEQPGCGWTGECTPSCNGDVCGPDGCGGVCGKCPYGSECDGGSCRETGCWNAVHCEGKNLNACWDTLYCEWTTSTCTRLECFNLSYSECTSGSIPQCEWTTEFGCQGPCESMDCTSLFPVCEFTSEGCTRRENRHCEARTSKYACEQNGPYCTWGTRSVDPACVEDCGDRECGTSGCGTSCGTCPDNTQCTEDGLCCMPDCDGKVCGDDGCGGSCGGCPDGQACQDGACMCAPACGGKDCGPDGCGGSCGTCTGGRECLGGACECVPTEARRCVDHEVWQVDSCGQAVPPALETCLLGCDGDHCATCEPTCDGKDCGPDGCGGTCGACGDGQLCQAGACVCAPDCDGKVCGDDGCGGSCGTCGDGQLCEGGTCLCTPDCDGKACGDDGCGGTCGACGDGQLCQAGACVCAPDCDGKVCGDDGCGASCGTCEAYESCQDGACVCTPDCDGMACGDDGCGGTCGACDGGQVCTEGACGCPEGDCWIGGTCVAEGSPCDDASLCTADDTCSAGACVGTPFCADSNVAFLTSVTVSPVEMGGLEGADALCNERAAAAGLPGHYVAWLSTAEANAIDRLVDAGGTPASGWRRLGDGLAAWASREDLVQLRAQYRVHRDELGTHVGTPVWTATTPQGVLATTAGIYEVGDCDGFTSAEGKAVMGQPGRVSNLWTKSGVSSCSASRALYCFGVDHSEGLPQAAPAGRLAFLTDARFYPGGGIEAADALCQAEATGAGLEGDFSALLATPGAPAASRLALDGSPWFRLDGLQLMETATTLAAIGAGPGTLVHDAVISVTPGGDYATGVWGIAWTGASNPFEAGTAGTTCQGWTSSDPGASALTNQGSPTLWFGFTATYTRPCDGGFRLMCFES